MTYSGQSVKRLEDHRLLLGQGTYVDDIQLPGLLHALVLRSPHAHATIKSIDTVAARSLTGVVAVVTATLIGPLVGARRVGSLSSRSTSVLCRSVPCGPGHSGPGAGSQPRSRSVSPLRLLGRSSIFLPSRSPPPLRSVPRPAPAPRHRV